MTQRRLLLICIVLFFAGCASVPKEESINIEDIREGPKEQVFYYSRGELSGGIPVTLYQGINDYFRDLPRTYPCSVTCPTDEEIQARYITSKVQDQELRQILDEIKLRTTDEKERVRIVISLVQRIPYDSESFENKTNLDRYPYQVLYDNKGVCSEKTRLLAYFLKNLGYETAILWFQKEDHSALGLKCPGGQAYKSTGYCFIETSAPSIPTYSEGLYPGFGKLRSDPKVIKLSEGKTYTGMGEEAGDAQEFGRLSKFMELTNGFTSQNDYYTWGSLLGRYGIETT